MKLIHLLLLGLITLGFAQEVDKGGIPAAQLAKSFKKLANGVAIWDVAEALEALDGKSGPIVWIDTRPKSFYDIGTLKGALLMPYDKKGREPAGTMTKADLDKVSSSNAGAKLAIFCQGPECHRSYNVCLRAVAEWGYKPSQIIWFRDGYPGLQEYLDKDPKLARKKSKYLQGKDIE